MMLAIIGILFVSAVIFLFEIPPLFKKKWWREIIVFCIMLLAGLTLNILISKNIPIPNPIDLITKMYNPIANFIERILS